jgi:redox-sensitive bicupin YhaK (pirin superfamily)
MKKVLHVQKATPQHWVGDGFPVRSLFSYSQHGALVSPFLLLDHAGPAEFVPSDSPRGVDEHPHRGFETVTIVYQGEVEHRDSAGNHGRVGPGDVQWMTAAAGVVHEEKHSRAFTARGGTLEMVQLWVNLPAEFKMSPPRYQELLAQSIPTVSLDDGAGTLRVIAGEFTAADGTTTRGPAQTFTRVNLWDARLSAGRRAELREPAGDTALALVLKGSVTWGDGQTAGAGDMTFFDRTGNRIVATAAEDATVLFLGGTPIDEPIAGYGPFVMNTEAEIRQALDDYRSGRMGTLAAV